MSPSSRGPVCRSGGNWGPVHPSEVQSAGRIGRGVGVQGLVCERSEVWDLGYMCVQKLVQGCVCKKSVQRVGGYKNQYKGGGREKISQGGEKSVEKGRRTIGTSSKRHLETNAPTLAFSTTKNKTNNEGGIGGRGLI